MSETPKLTRREAIGGVAAAGAGALIGPAAARAAAAGHPMPRAATGARVFSEWLGDLASPSAVLAPGRSFCLAGLEWSAPAAARVQLRTRSAGGHWGPWATASVQGHDGDAFASRPGQRFGEPLWIGQADELQLRSSHPVSGVRVNFVAETGAGPGSTLAAAASLPVAAPDLPAGLNGQPRIIARSAWASGRRPAAGPFYGTVRLAFVHHTDNPNGYSAAEVPSLLLAIYDYHRYVRGFYDIAYNFIIDAYGRIWEARAGGIDEPVVGAHAGGYNGVSTGIAVLGTFMSVVPPAPAIQSLERLLAWKLSLHGIPTTGRVTVEVNPADAFYTPFRPGQHVSLPRIAGHRDGDLTDCPGDAFYHRLPSIRPRAAALAGAPPRLTLAAGPAAVGFGTPVSLAGRATMLDGRTGIADQLIEIQTVAGLGVTRTLTTATTDADGHWSAPLTLNRNSLVRALHRAAPAAVSDVSQVGVRPVITLARTAPSPARVTGTVAPGKRRVTLDVYRLVRGRRRLIHKRHADGQSGTFAADLRVGAGTYQVVARTAAGGGTLAGASASLTVTV